MYDRWHMASPDGIFDTAEKDPDGPVEKQDPMLRVGTYMLLLCIPLCLYLVPPVAFRFSFVPEKCRIVLDRTKFCPKIRQNFWTFTIFHDKYGSENVVNRTNQRILGHLRYLY